MTEGTDNSIKRNNWLKLASLLRLLKFQQKKGVEDCSNGVDIISDLPDDILISIISKLTLQEAAAIPRLSTRWRHLRDATTRLIFPPFLPFIGLYDEHLAEILEQRLPRYISRINQALDSYKHGLELKEFRVHMHCLKGAPIERWLEFALSREVEVIDMHMSWLRHKMAGDYSFGISDLIMKKETSSLPGLRTLKHLSLSTVHVDDREIEVLLSSCPLLESLSIEGSKRLKNVLIAGGSLKHLDISLATNVESIEIRDAMNLASLRLRRHVLQKSYVLKLDNVPRFTELVTEYSELDNILSGIPSSILDQLRLLKLYATVDYGNEDLSIPQLVNVKHLKLEVVIEGYPDLYVLFPIIEACCSLEKLEIKMKWVWIQKEFGSPAWSRSRTKTLSKYLKTLKLSGYLGWEDAAVKYGSYVQKFGAITVKEVNLGCENGEMEFIYIMIKNAKEGLEEIVVEPCDKTHLALTDELDDDDFLATAATRAWRQLRPITPLSINLKIKEFNPFPSFLLHPLGILRRISHVVLNFPADVFRWFLRVLSDMYMSFFWLRVFFYVCEKIGSRIKEMIELGKLKFDDFHKS